MKPLAALACLCLSAALLAADQSASISVTKENALSFYRGFHRLTKTPHLVGGALSELCDRPRPEALQKEKRAIGPHFGDLIHLYVNTEARDAVHRRADAYPPGAIIVKEKLATDGSVGGVGGMIKRSPGYDPEHGDWEYFYTDRDSGFSSGRLENCVDCHRNAKSTDHVFGLRRLAAPRATPATARE